jgi:leucyl aminopeptidase
MVGLGERKKATADTLRKAAATAANKAVAMKAGTLSFALHRALEGKVDLAAAGRATAEGTYFGSFRYDEFVTETENGRLATLKAEIVEPDAQRLHRIEKGVAAGAVIGRMQSTARSIANRPGNVINPPTLAEEAKRLIRGTAGLSCTVLDEKQMAKLGMGGILAVGSGSKTPPRFIVIKYAPRTASRNVATVGLVGKAVTFDSGGISIKPSANMEQMKLDKSGGIAVMSAIKAAAELKLPLKVFAIIPAAENMPSGSSCRPGDIVTTHSGKTVEIQNTDAEGRMLLCDAIHYAVKQGCDVIIDVATLTGACMVALGTYKAGLMSNDDGLTRQLQKAAEESGEPLWPMPCGDEYA